MNIHVEKIVENDMVVFSSEVGSGIGLWCSDRVPELSTYNAEFNFTVPVLLGKNSTIVQDQRKFITHNGEMNEIQGMVESVDEDGMIFLRLSPSCLAMIENDNESIKEGDYILIRIDAYDLELFTLK